MENRPRETNKLPNKKILITIAVGILLFYVGLALLLINEFKRTHGNKGNPAIELLVEVV